MDREKLAFVFIGLLLFILGFDVLMIVHYVKNLSGPSLIAVASILGGTFLACMAAWFCCKPKAWLWLKIAAFACKIVLIGVGGLSATAIITLYFHQKNEAKAAEVANVQLAQKTESEIAKLKAQKESRTAEQDAELKRLETLKQAAVELRRTAGAQAARQFIQQNSGTATLSTPEPEATPNLVAAAEKVNQQAAKIEEQHTFKAWLLEYADGGVYYVPTAANLLVFIVLSAFLMFGRTSETSATSQQSGNSKQPPGFTPPMQPAPATAKHGGNTTVSSGNTFIPPSQ